ncbi:MAG: hypothetical protein RDU20_21890 [Desulfomonilaceae bacterium]|nr:hypothetical protein [Desulfomonilaceae bacterium]
MKNLLVLAAVVGVLVLLVPSWGAAQYYGYYSPYFTAPPPPAPPPGAVGGHSPKRTMYYRMAPDPLLYWKWSQYNAYRDYQQFHRSPLNPESDLSYMLRTF